jgi:mRNA-degrading endonuclease RelE of RelBE toxin-antitoxin system
MNYKVIPVDKFKKEAKRLIKKYPSLKSELTELAASLSIEPTQGTALGNNVFKIRVSIKSKGKGKSGGARIITYVISPQKEVYLLTIYDKAEFDSIDDKMLRRIIDVIPNEK